MKKSSIAFVLIALVLPTRTTAQDVSTTAQSSNTSESAAQQQSATAAQAQGSVERAVRRFRIGVSGGVAFDRWNSSTLEVMLPSGRFLRRHWKFDPVLNLGWER